MSSSTAFFSVESTDARRREHLMPGKTVEVAIEVRHIDRHMGDRLRAINKDDGAVAVGHGNHVARRNDRSEGVRNLWKCDKLSSRTEKLLVLLQDDLAAIVDRCNSKTRSDR